MRPQIGKLVEYVTNSGKLVYARIIAIEIRGIEKIFVCQTPRGNLLHLVRRDFRLVKSKAGSTRESFTTIFKG